MPIIFAEESYEVASAGEFWLEALSRLSAQAPDPEAAEGLRRTWEELRTIRDDRMLADRCLGALMDFADWKAKSLVLVVENLNAMFADMADAEDVGWRLRQVLQTEPRVFLLASATSRFDAIDNPDRALYDLFRPLTLRPLHADECAVLWESVSGSSRPTAAIRALQILTGGSPRLLAILARFGADMSFRELMAELLDLIDDHTEYFKSHLETLPAQERRVYLALAALWKPATTREIADRARLDTSKCSSQLARLVDRGAVEVTGGSPRRKLYYLTERLYNIYYLMRRSRGPDPLIEALIRFMEAYYSPDELKDIGVRIARDALRIDAATQPLYRRAFVELASLPSLETHRNELLEVAPSDFLTAFRQESADREQAEATDRKNAWNLFNKAIALVGEDRFEEALTVCDEAVESFGDSKFPTVLGVVARFPVYKASIFWHLKQFDEVLVAYDETVQQFGHSDVPRALYWAAHALNSKGAVLEQLQQPEEAVAAHQEVVQRFGNADSPPLIKEVATALLRKGASLGTLNEWEHAVAAFDDMIRRYRINPSPDISESVGHALLGKADALVALKRPEEATAARHEVVRLFDASNTLPLLRLVAVAFIDDGIQFLLANRPEDAAGAFDEVIRRFESNTGPAWLSAVATAFRGKAMALRAMNRFEDALAALDEAMRRLGPSGKSSDPELTASSIFEKGEILSGLNRPDAASTAWNDLICRYSGIDVPQVRYSVARALLAMADLELSAGECRAAIDKASQALDAYGDESPDVRWRSHLVRASARLDIGDTSACEQDVIAALALLPSLNSSLRESLDALMKLSLALGPKRMRELIVASPSRHLLLPLTTALEGELGIESQVAQEVKEVAEDIRRDLANLWKDEEAGTN